jgi:hypothetical protein
LGASVSLWLCVRERKVLSLRHATYTQIARDGWIGIRGRDKERVFVIEGPGHAQRQARHGERVVWVESILYTTLTRKIEKLPNHAE